MLGFVCLTSCDVAQVALDPTFPGVVQTWNLPASDMSIGVAELLPTGVDTNPTKTAFIVSVGGINYTRQLAPNCAACQAITGTTAPKPDFTINPGSGSSTSLPANVVSAQVLGATMTYSIQNGFTFDPLFVNPSTPASTNQGWMIITISSGSFVLARDSIRGGVPPGGGAAVTLAAGATFNRTLLPCTTAPAGQTCIQSGPINGPIAVDLFVRSPAGEPVFMDAFRSLTATASVSNLQVASATINVSSAPMDSDDPQELPADLPESMVDNIESGALEMTITNPFAVTGNVNINFAVRPGLSYTKTIAMPSATSAVRTVSFTGDELRNILKGNGENSPTLFSMSGAVSSLPGGILVTPSQTVSISNRIVFAVRIGGDN